MLSAGPLNTKILLVLRYTVLLTSCSSTEELTGHKPIREFHRVSLAHYEADLRNANTTPMTCLSRRMRD